MDNQALKTYIEKLINRGSSATELARKCGISDRHVPIQKRQVWSE